jgi:hypothetical protein
MVARLADRLARESTANNINCSEVVFSAFSDIFKPLHIGPMLRQHSPTIIINLNLPSASHPGPVEAKVEATNTRE